MYNNVCSSGTYNQDSILLILHWYINTLQRRGAKLHIRLRQTLVFAKAFTTLIAKLKGRKQIKNAHLTNAVSKSLQ